DAALAASIFHYKETSVKEVKAYLKERGVNVR
ncbi:imidazole glycerol phosphate synthase subunit HisF, partial [Bacillaceae bacterium HSR45]|nr:imidazole glycerol phosphate synthase subunit HisF [Bacillaceae bacterium HSR45]